MRIQQTVALELQQENNLSGDISTEEESVSSDGEDVKDMVAKISALREAFQDIEIGPSGHRAIGLALLASDQHSSEAMDELIISVKLCRTNEEKFASTVALAKCVASLNMEEEAYENAREALEL